MRGRGPEGKIGRPRHRWAISSKGGVKHKKVIAVSMNIQHENENL